MCVCVYVRSLLDLVAVQHILAMEERQAYNAAQGVIDTSAPLATPNTSGGGAQQQQQQQQQPVLTAGQALRQLHAAGLYQEVRMARTHTHTHTCIYASYIHTSSVAVCVIPYVSVF